MNYLFLLLFFISFSSFAQHDTSKLIFERDKLDYTNIREPQQIDTFPSFSAMRSTMKVNDIPITSYTIMRDEIQNNGYVTLTDVLKSVPGIKVSQPGNAEDGETFLCRGLIGNSYMKIMINSIPIQPSVLGTLPISAQLPIRQAEKIEIIFGPASSIYGADAAVGVINIVTKLSDKGNFAQADVVGGEYGYGYGNFTMGGQTIFKSDILKYNIYGSFMRVLDKNVKYTHDSLYAALGYMEQIDTKYDFGNGIVKRPLEITPQFLNSFGIKEADFLNALMPPNYKGNLEHPVMNELPEYSNSMGFALRYKGISILYDFLYRRTQSSIGTTPFLHRYDNPLNFYGETIQRLVFTHNKKWRNYLITSNLSYLRERADNQSSRGITYCKDFTNAHYYTASDDFYGDLFVTAKPSNRWEILIGTSAQVSGNLPQINPTGEPFYEKNYSMFSTAKKNIDTIYGSFGYNPIVFESIGGFAQVHYKYKRFIFSGGIRKDYNSIYKQSSTPRLAILYKLTKKLSLRYSSGQAFKAPTSSYTYYSVAYADPKHPNKISYAFIPNKDLKPEKFKANELGVNYSPNERLSMDFCFYNNTVDDPIYFTFTKLDTNQYHNTTLDEETRINTNATGASSELNGFQFTVNAKSIDSKFMVRASYLYSEGKETLPNDSGSIDVIRMVPKHFGQLYLEWKPIRSLFFSLNCVFSSSWTRRYVPSAESLRRDYFKIDGYATADFTFRAFVTKQFSIFFKLNNIFDKEYAGLDATGTDVDLRYNPQLKRNFRAGISYRFE